MAGKLGKYGYFAGAAILILMSIFIVCKIMFSANDELLSTQTLLKVLNILTISIAVVIVAVPEGLPLAVSIAMAFSMEHMKNDKLLIKKL